MVTEVKPGATVPVQSTSVDLKNSPTTNPKAIPAGAAGADSAAQRVLSPEAQDQTAQAAAPSQADEAAKEVAAKAAEAARTAAARAAEVARAAEEASKKQTAPTVLLGDSNEGSSVPGGPSVGQVSSNVLPAAGAAASLGAGAPEMTAGNTAANVVGQSWRELAQTAAPYAVATLGGAIVAKSVYNLTQKQPAKPEAAKIALGSAIVVCALAPQSVANAYNAASSGASKAYATTTTFVGQTYNDVATWASAKWTALTNSDAVTGTVAAVSKAASGTVAAVSSAATGTVNLAKAAVSTTADIAQSYGPYVGAVAGAALVTKSLSNLNTTNSKAREIGKIAAGALIIAGSVYKAPADKKDVAITALVTAYSIDKWNELRGNELCGRALSTVKARWVSLKDSACALKDKAQTKINTWKRPAAPVATGKADHHAVPSHLRREYVGQLPKTADAAAAA